ncbi:MAG: iron-sulfur cluster assembly scaffold protein [Candidatus Marsarchaeota archaeon]|nr:iron-sulfur cluster assembly scaffold protein [Candidatus Marsarchaeota archaeon]
MDLYAEEIVSHYEHPHNKGKPRDANTNYHEYNPLCGDDITIYLKIEGGIVKSASFDGTGCAISVGSASMLTDLLKGKKVGDVEKMGPKDIIGMLGIDPGPTRLKCATLSLKATQKAIFVYEKKDASSVSKDL